MAITPLIPEIKALSPASKLENPLHRPPSTFIAGQIVHAVVASEEAPNLFTLQIGGQKVPVETTANLATGQSLSLEVTALTPQLQLKVVDQAQMNGLDQRIGSSLHTLMQQGQAFSKLAALPQYPDLLAQLPPSSQQVLQQLQANLLGSTQTDKNLEALIIQITSSFSTHEGTAVSPLPNQTLGELLRKIAVLPSAPAAIRQGASELSNFFLASGADTENIPFKSTRQTANLGTTTLTENSKLTQEAAILQLQGLSENLQTVLQPLIAQQLDWSNPNQPLAQLVKFLLQAAQPNTAQASLPQDGRQIRQSLDNIGTNMERLLLQGNTKEAAQTLKFALLDLSSKAPSPSLQQAVNNALDTIQLSQLVQIRLGAESIFFLPLPFPFLQSGFLLLPPEQKKQRQDESPKKRSQRPTGLSLYLQLEGLGNLQITVQQEGENISLTFYSQDAPRAQFICQHKDELKEILTTGTLYNTQFLIGAKEPVKIIIEKMLHAPTGMVNISV